MAEYLSYAEQSFHYFNRPHDGPPAAAVESPAAWRGPDLKDSQAWRHALSTDHVGEIERALEHAAATGRSTGDLTADDFPLPTLAPTIRAWRDELANGRGFQVVSGVPVQRWTAADTERFFWCLGLHMGRPGAQNPKGDLLGHVTDTGADAADPYVRLYQTASHIAFHCDAADVVGLLCLSAGASGGASRIASSVAVHNEILRRRPDLVPRLYEPFLLDIRNEDRSGELRYLPIPPCRFADGRLRTFYHSDYFRSVVRHDDVPPFDPQERELLDLYEEIAGSPEFRIDMELQPGNIQWLSNHSVVHSRTAYRDSGIAEGSRRHLLRLWLSIE